MTNSIPRRPPLSGPGKTVLLGPCDGQIEPVQARYPDAVERRLSDGSVLILLPEIQLRVGWNKPTTSVCFIVPVGYPVAPPDSFFADCDLRLANGAVPRNAREQSLPQLDGAAWLWFSWHVTTWNATRDSYLTYVRVVERRLAEAA